jgi:hypothetical protein
MNPRSQGSEFEKCAVSLDVTRAAALLIVTLAVIVGLGCAKKPVPDTDGSSAQSRGLTLGRWHSDQLYCHVTDCSDWYKVALDARGDLVIDVVSPDGVGKDFSVSLASASAEVLTRASSRGSGRAQLEWSTRAGTYLIEIASADENKQPQAYQIQARFTPEPPPPPPPEPQFETIEAEVIEIEGSAARPDAVLVDKGHQAGVQRGLQGRLYDGDAQIGSIDIVETYPEGSRATIRGTLSAPVTPSTRAEIDVPVNGAGSAPEEP